MKIGPIEKDVLLEIKTKVPRGRKRIYPIYDMDINESFVVTTKTEDEMNHAKGILSTLMALCAKKYGKKFTMRQLKKAKNRFQFRVWRIK
jgi:hypothetical protein